MLTNKLSFECKHCKVLVSKESNTLEIFEDEKILKNNEEIKEYNNRNEENTKKQRAELEEFGKNLRIFVSNKKSNILNRWKKYNLEIEEDKISIHTGKTWYVFTKEEAKDFISKTGLYCSKNKEDKLQAYFSVILNNSKYINEYYKYVICPLCGYKNFIPLEKGQLIIS